LFLGKKGREKEGKRETMPDPLVAIVLFFLSPFGEKEERGGEERGQGKVRAA